MISVVDPKPISNLTRLQFLDLSQCCQLTDESVTKFRFPELRKLDLQSNQGEERQNQVNVFHCFFCSSHNCCFCILFVALTDASLLELSRSLPILEELNVTQCVRVTDAGIVACARNLRRLRSLSFSCCDLVTDSALSAIMTYCPRSAKLLNPQIPKIEAVADYHVSSVVG